MVDQSSGPRPGIRLGRLRSRSTVRAMIPVVFFANLYFYVPALAPYWLARGVSLAQITILQAILIGTALLFDLPTGALADHIGRRWTYTAALGIQAGSECIFLLAHSFWAFVPGQIIGGLSGALMSGSLTALVYESLPDQDRPSAMKRAMSAIGATVQLGGLIAYIGGGLLVADLRISHIVLAIQLTIVALLIAFGGSLLIPEHGRTNDRPRHRPALTTLMRSGFALLHQSAGLRRIVLAYLLSSAFPLYLMVLYQPYLLQSGAGGGWLGPALGPGSVCALFGQRYAYAFEVKLGVRWAILTTTALPGVLYLLMAVIRQPILAVALFCLQWGAIPLKEPLFSGYLNAHIPSEQRATVLSLVNTILNIYAVLIGLLLGAIADASLSWIFGAMGAVVLGGALLFRISEDDMKVEEG